MPGKHGKDKEKDMGAHLDKEKEMGAHDKEKDEEMNQGPGLPPREREQMMAKQDQDLSELSRGIGDLKNIGVAIGEGVSLTSALLDDIGKGVDKTDGSLQKRTQKAKVLQKQVQGNCGLYVCIFLLIILLVFNISSKGFKNI